MGKTGLRPGRTRVWGLLGVCALVAVFLLWHPDEVESLYSDYDAAVAAGALKEGGWMPAWLPGSATDIREMHNVDTNERWLTFRFASPDGGFTKFCTSARVAPVAYPIGRPRQWWPDWLIAGSGQSDRPGYDYYACGKREFLAVDRELLMAWFWGM